MVELLTYDSIINVKEGIVELYGKEYSTYFLKELAEEIKKREEKEYPWVKHNSHYESGGKSYYAKWEQRGDEIRNHIVYEELESGCVIPEPKDEWDDFGWGYEDGYPVPIPSKPKHRKWIGKRPLPPRKKREFGRNVSRIHVHVYKVEGKMYETDFVDASITDAEAKDIAIETVKREPINEPVKSDCEYIAVSFRVSNK